MCADDYGGSTYTWVSESDTFSAGGAYEVKAKCPTNYDVVGGGFEKPYEPDANSYVYEDTYGPNYHAWVAGLNIQHYLSNDNSLTSYAVCGFVGT